MQTEYLTEFNRLLEEKKKEDLHFATLKGLISSIIEIFPQGIYTQQHISLNNFLEECDKQLPEKACQAIKHKEIWSLVCDKNDIILAAAPNLCSSLKYASDELIGAYKGKLWVERPDKKDEHQLNRAAYLIYEVKQKHFHGTHEDAYITKAGEVISILQHRLDLITADNVICGYLYLIIDLQKGKDIDYALTDIMDHIEHDLSQNTAMDLTPEMKIFLVKDMVQTHEYIDSVMGNAIDAILVTSPSGLIISSNQSFKKLVAYTAKELRNQPVTIVSPGIGTYPLTIGESVAIEEQYFFDMAAMIDTLFKLGKVYGFRQYFKNKSGALIPTEVNISLLRDKQGEITGFVRNIHDLSEKVILQKKLLEKDEKITLLKKELTEFYGPDNIIGKSPAIQNIFRLVTKVADTDSTVLLQGESGTGKELIAHALYHHSPRSKGPFIVLNCGAIPRDLLESELFGHVKGSFTGAIRDKKGLFEEANGGVIFLDEIGELHLDMQVKLLRAIQEREIKRVGDNRSIKIDVRIIAATHRDLLEETRKKRFREDLYYRINVITLKIPALRDRMEDIPLLSDFFIKKLQRTKEVVTVSREAMKIFLAYSYPGNVRELENIIERALI
ncbi:MAG: sigma 54-interacting transcriptional regulator, partial [Pseudomonadota bacterium]